MKKLLPLLLLACTGCGTVGVIRMKVLPSDDIYAMVSLRELTVGNVITQSDVMTTKIGISHRELLHPFRPRPGTEFTTDASKIVGHTVKTFIPAGRAISPQRDLS
jgi:hypothetical protein